MKLSTVLLFILLIPLESFAQYQQMLGKPYKDKAQDLEVLYENVARSNHDSSYIVSYTTKMKQWALDHNDKELAFEADLLSAYAFSSLSEKEVHAGNFQALLKDFIAIEEKSKKENLIYIQARAVYGIALVYWWNENYEKAFEWLMRSSSLLDKMNSENFPYMAEHLNFIGRCYYYFKDYKIAKTYYKRSSQLERTKFNTKAVSEAKNSLGLCYQKLGELRKAKHWFLKVINDSVQFSSPVWKGIASGNLGYNYYLQNDYKRAVPLFKKDISMALNTADYGLAAGSAIPLASIFMAENQDQAAKQKIEEAHKYIQKSGQTDRLRKLYPVMSKWYAKNGQPDSSAIFLDSTIVANKMYSEKYSRLKLMHASQKVEAKQRELEILALKAKTRLKVSQRNSIIILVIVLLIGSILAYWFRNKYLLKEQQVKELALQNAEKALKSAKIKLGNLTEKIKKDNSLIVELKKGKGREINKELLAELRAKNILTQEDWAEYQDLFHQAYPKFLPKLKTSYPDLTPAERRCMCLEKIQLSTQEMALVLGVSPNAIRVTNYRIRKKLNLENQTDLLKILQKL